jgi:hypothetical protein
MRFQYSISDPAQDEFDSLPRILLTLRYNNQQLDILGLVDSGSTVSVLPHDIGLQLGARWDDRKANLRLAGNLGKSPAMPLSIMATLGDFAPVQLVFAWVKVANAPLILGQTNFFMEFDVHFYRSQLEFEIEPKF